jgi:hypothetical protein
MTNDKNEPSLIPKSEDELTADYPDYTDLMDGK